MWTQSHSWEKMSDNIKRPQWEIILTLIIWWESGSSGHSLNPSSKEWNSSFYNSIHHSIFSPLVLHPQRRIQKNFNVNTTFIERKSLLFQSHDRETAIHLAESYERSKTLFMICWITFICQLNVFCWINTVYPV